MESCRLTLRGFALGAIIAVGFHQGQASGQEQEKKARHTSSFISHIPMVFNTDNIPSIADSDSDDCTNRHRKVKYLRFHIIKDFFNNLSANKICPVSSSGEKGCTWESKPNSSNDDDDGKTEKPVAPSPKPEGANGINWDTPLDIDLSYYWKDYDIVQIKIILDDPNMTFLSPVGSGNLTDSHYAVMQGDEGFGMFVCRSDVHLAVPKIDTTPAVPAWLTVRVKPTSNDHYGGLNIGVLYPVGNFVLPLYIDPKVHHDG